ncbi:MAG: hypothetical protein US72_C0002G0002 [Microgenomates group bacterium GW2011_GWC1_38_12]|uniref:Uncharacterized protein n=2 Tax=Candidatus Vogeliibacteriota TaxID=1817922 RepID=A0A1G2QEZ8_9BACT|nr:MAG: hypothetical protein US72_C0002G0002 [Microgenomates group bacterium GW2011_GWC1_38_12]KKS78108.1 MAG: hypothetical protein UV50_C0001G0018 [Parcubacteria group bacterium GW2011_GWB1_42_9]OHA59164.1 MAG: hypothetical protein A2370_03190 [Candidatus Vogelbacteria bacterium RIFOXYB1_FULL_42_16]OHA60305.1 MAG: hypothetical protein A2607_01665 [Candidatus Vogelbacteria bacterium RIFOXYD1_FULL_42_15]
MENLEQKSWEDPDKDTIEKLMAKDQQNTKDSLAQIESAVVAGKAVEIPSDEAEELINTYRRHVMSGQTVKKYQVMADFLNKLKEQAPLIVYSLLYHRLIYSTPPAEVTKFIDVVADGQVIKESMVDFMKKQITEIDEETETVQKTSPQI